MDKKTTPFSKGGLGDFFKKTTNSSAGGGQCGYILVWLSDVLSKYKSAVFRVQQRFCDKHPHARPITRVIKQEGGLC